MDEDAIKRAQGARLAAARAAAGYRSKNSAATENRWTVSTYSAHERGTRKMGEDDAERYAKRFRQLGVAITGQTILYGSDSNERVEALMSLLPLGIDATDNAGSPKPGETPQIALADTAIRYGLVTLGHDLPSAGVISRLAEFAVRWHEGHQDGARLRGRDPHQTRISTEPRKEPPKSGRASKDQ